MKKRIVVITILMLLATVFSQVSCKKSTETETFTVTVIVSEGVTGTPAAGVYTHRSGSTVTYNYALQTGYSDLAVLLDGTKVNASSTLTVSANRVLQAYAAGYGRFTLTTTVATGVSGSPVAGAVTYNEGDVVSYNYTLNDGYTNLVVKVDGDEVAASGTITMSKDHTLAVTCEAKENIVGTWAMTETYSDGGYFKTTVTFSGTLDAGTVIDSDGGTGTYTVADNGVDFTLVFPGVNYTYTGSISTDDASVTTMSGTCKRYQSSTLYYSGSWSATKNAASSGISNPAAVRKGDVGH